MIEPTPFRDSRAYTPTLVRVSDGMVKGKNFTTCWKDIGMDENNRFLGMTPGYS
jgi:hypothetical protein